MLDMGQPSPRPVAGRVQAVVRTPEVQRRTGEAGARLGLSRSLGSGTTWSRGLLSCLCQSRRQICIEDIDDGLPVSIGLLPPDRCILAAIRHWIAFGVVPPKLVGPY